MPDEDFTHLLHKLDVMHAILREKQDALTDKMDNMWAEIKGLRADTTGELRMLEKRMTMLEQWQTKVTSNINLLRWMIGASGIGFILSIIVLLQEVGNHWK